MERFGRPERTERRGGEVGESMEMGLQREETSRGFCVWSSNNTWQGRGGINSNWLCSGPVCFRVSLTWDWGGLRWW